ncbi:MAG: 2,5-diamino-6-(ribosylamino)-4(3H)-pyrimidinone 5'-phosphate reductase [Alyxoria varia]|nr:MAG: 2,5-diamino-6-(ribosylamino)-4(3H)-pyrimidinone 5'-phosphate reductase [Alyxoria varia]
MSNGFLDIPQLAHRQILDEYLPVQRSDSSGPTQRSKEHSSDGIENQNTVKPFVTLTYAQSLDSRIAAAPGERTALSGQESKAMTHYLRGKHDAVIVGARTAKADDPGLNCRIRGADGDENKELKCDKGRRNEDLDLSSDQRRALLGVEELQLKQPRPVVLDRHAIFDIDSTSKLFRIARSTSGKSPWILCSDDIPQAISTAREEALRDCEGELIRCIPEDLHDFARALSVLANKGIESVMIEGGASVIDQVLGQFSDLVDTVILTIAPVWLGRRGLQVALPERLNLADVKWITMGSDAVICYDTCSGDFTDFATAPPCPATATAEPTAPVAKVPAKASAGSTKRRPLGPKKTATKKPPKPVQTRPRKGPAPKPTKRPIDHNFKPFRAPPPDPEPFVPGDVSSSAAVVKSLKKDLLVDIVIAGIAKELAGHGTEEEAQGGGDAVAELVEAVGVQRPEVPSAVAGDGLDEGQSNGNGSDGSGEGSTEEEKAPLPLVQFS